MWRCRGFSKLKELSITSKEKAFFKEYNETVFWRRRDEKLTLVRFEDAEKLKLESIRLRYLPDNFVELKLKNFSVWNIPLLEFPISILENHSLIRIKRKESVILIA